MRGIMFPNSNIIFTVQTHDPAEKRKPGDANANGGFNWTMWGSDLYSGWEIVDYAAIALAESAPLLLTPGRRCENGELVPGERSRLDPIHQRNGGSRKSRIPRVSNQKPGESERHQRRCLRCLPPLPSSLSR